MPIGLRALTEMASTGARCYLRAHMRFAASAGRFKALWVVAVFLVAACGRKTLVVVGNDGAPAGDEAVGEGEGDSPPAEGEGDGEGGEVGAGGGDGGGDAGGEGEGEGEGEGVVVAPPYCAGVDACREEAEPAGPEAAGPITWCSSVRQPLAVKCATCHSGGDPSSGWSAETYDLVFADGARADGAANVVPCCRESELLRAIRGEDDVFPHVDVITGVQRKNIEAWIAVHGAPKGEGCD